jgi:ribonuclease HI
MLSITVGDLVVKGRGRDREWDDVRDEALKHPGRSDPSRAMKYFHQTLLQHPAVSSDWGASYSQSPPCPCGSVATFKSRAGITIDNSGSSALLLDCPNCKSPTLFTPYLMMTNCWVTRQTLDNAIVPCAGHPCHIPHRYVLDEHGPSVAGILFRKVIEDPRALILSASTSRPWQGEPTLSEAIGGLHLLDCGPQCETEHSCTHSTRSISNPVLSKLVQTFGITSHYTTDMWNVCKTETISEWFSTTTPWPWTGCSGNPLTDAWPSPNGLVTVTPDILDRLTQAVDLPSANFLLLLDRRLGITLSFDHTLLCTTTTMRVSVPDPLPHCMGTLFYNQGNWAMYHVGHRAQDDPVWETAMDVIRNSADNWSASITLSKRVALYGVRRNKEKKEAEETRWSEVQESLTSLLDDLNSCEPHRASACQRKLVEAISAAMISCSPRQREELRTFATESLGPPEDWTNSHAAMAKAFSRSDSTLLYPDESQHQWNSLTAGSRWEYTYTTGSLEPRGPVLYRLLRPEDLCWIQTPSVILPGKVGKISWKDHSRAQGNDNILLDVGDQTLILALGKRSAISVGRTPVDTPVFWAKLVLWSDFLFDHVTVNHIEIQKTLEKRVYGIIELQVANWAQAPVHGVLKPKSNSTPRSTMSWTQASAVSEGLPPVGVPIPVREIVARKWVLPESKEALALFSSDCADPTLESSTTWQTLKRTVEAHCSPQQPPKKVKPTPPPVDLVSQHLQAMIAHLRSRSSCGLREMFTSEVRSAFPDLAELVDLVCRGCIDWSHLYRPLAFALSEAQRTTGLERFLDERKTHLDELITNTALFKDNITEAYKRMLGAPSARADTSLAASVWQVRNHGKTKATSLLRLSQKEGNPGLPPIQRLPPELYWSTESILSGISLAAEVTVFRDWVWPEPEEQPIPNESDPSRYLITEDPPVFEPSESMEEWLDETPPPLSDALVEVTWPSHSIASESLHTLIRAELEALYDSDDFVTTASGATVFKLINPQTVHALDPTGLEVDGQIPEVIISTDGSGTKLLTGCGDAGGFGTLILCGGEVFVMLGGKDCTTSAEMEMTAVFEGVTFATSSTPDSILSISDYITWIRANLDLGEATLFTQAAKRRGLWMGITDTVRDWKTRDPGTKLWRKHVNSHVTVGGHWGHALNEIADLLAALAKEARREHPQLVPDWTLAPPPHNSDLDLSLSRPITVGELGYVIRKRHSKAPDTDGLTNQILKAAGAPLWEKLSRDINECAYRGSYLLNPEAGTVRGKLMEIGKDTGGTRSLTIPNVVQLPLCAVLSNRLNLGLMAARAVSVAQKCNILGVSGADDNAFLYKAAIFEFFNAGNNKLLRPGQMRIFFFNDFACAFDSMEFNVLLHALHVCLGTGRFDRYLSLVRSYLTNTQIAVVQGKMAVLVGKLAGAPQGMPDSGLLFQVVVEYLRLITPREGQPPIIIHSQGREENVLLHIQFADDATLACDATVDTVATVAQPMVDELAKSSRMLLLVENPKKLRCFALLYDGTGVSTVDPGLTILHEGRRMNIQAYTETDVIKLNGLPTNTVAGSGAAVSTLRLRDQATINSIQASNFPIQAKLKALGELGERSSEYLFKNAWIPDATLRDLDRLVMKTLRSIFGFNLPNSYIKAELKLGLRSERYKIVHLDAFIKKLLSTDPRVKRLALVVIEFPTDQGRPRMPADPPFFNWPKIPVRQPKEGIRNLGAHVAFLANALGVGLEVISNEIVITLSSPDGTRKRIADPSNLLKCLSNRAYEAWTKNLDERASTRTRKTRPGAFSISWGDAGRKLGKAERKLETGFLRNSRFNDKDVKIIMSLRLLLWKTSFRKGIMGGPNARSLCYCGQVQTATHILEIPSSCIVHSLALRVLPQRRHTDLVNTTLAWLSSCKPKGVSIFLVEGSPARASEDHVELQEKWASLLRDRQLVPDDRGVVHWKPDIVIFLQQKDRPTQVKLLDLSAGSPDKLYWENEVISACKETHTELNLDWFDEDGRFTSDGLLALPAQAQEAANKLNVPGQEKVLKTMRYMKRYAAWADLFRTEMIPGCSVDILALPISVTGTVPTFTRNRIKQFATDTQADQLLKSLRIDAWSAAIKIFDAWQHEGNPSPF